MRGCVQKLEVWHNGLRKARDAMWIMEMAREKRNLSAVDIPHFAKAIRGIDAEIADAKALSFDEMRSRVGVRKSGNRRSERMWTATADGGPRRDFEVGDRDLPTLYRLPLRLPSAEKRRSDGREGRSVIFPPGAASVAKAAR